MENHEWVYFLTIAEEGYLTKAAQKLFVSQPALSQYLQKLEKRLEMKLFERKNNNALVLTPAGVRYRRYCEEALQLWETAHKEMRSQGNDHTVVLAMNYPKYEKLMDEYCRSRADMSHILVRRVYARDLPKQLLTGEIQIAFGAYYGEHPQLQYRCLKCREMDLVVPWEHPLASKSYLISGNESVRIRLSEVGDLPFALLKEPLVWRQVVDDYFRKTDFSANVVLETETEGVLWQAVAQQHLATFHIQEFESGYLPQGTVPVALDPPLYYAAGVFYRKDFEITPALMKMIERLSAYFCQ